MPTVSFSPNIRSHVKVDSCEVAGSTVGEALASVERLVPRLHGYLFDDDGRVRKHIAMIVNGTPVRDRESLTDEVAEEDEIFVMQALSGG